MRRILGGMALTILVGAGGSVGCGPVVITPLGTSSASISFEADVVPGFTSRNCSSAVCHSTANASSAGGLALDGTCTDVFDNVTGTGPNGDRVVPGDPAVSVLLLMASNQMAHSGGVAVDSSHSEYTAWWGWIEQGATGDCL